MKVLFLDIDGVLNAHEWDEEVLCGQIHCDKVDRLNRVLRATGAKVVLSSAWRYILHRGECNLIGLEWLFRSHGILAGRLVGVTRPDTMERPVYSGDPGTLPQVNERGHQILEWIHLAPGMVGVPVKQYAVVDDLDLGITDARHPCVITDGKTGLTDADADRLIQLLNCESTEG